MGDVEVDQKPELESSELQVRDHLRLVHRQQFLHAFHFDDEALLDDEIDPIRVRKLHAFIHDRQAHLVLNMQTTRGQLVEQAGTNGAFKHPRAERAVNLQGTADNSMARFVRSHVRSIARVGVLSVGGRIPSVAGRSQGQRIPSVVVRPHGGRIVRVVPSQRGRIVGVVVPSQGGRILGLVVRSHTGPALCVLGILCVLGDGYS
jgi:hypothetical protein